jgi:hypothetical protein
MTEQGLTDREGKKENSWLEKGKMLGHESFPPYDGD